MNISRSAEGLPIYKAYLVKSNETAENEVDKFKKLVDELFAGKAKIEFEICSDASKMKEERSFTVYLQKPSVRVGFDNVKPILKEMIDKSHHNVFHILVADKSKRMGMMLRDAEYPSGVDLLNPESKLRKVFFIATDPGSIPADKEEIKKAIEMAIGEEKSLISEKKEELKQPASTPAPVTIAKKAEPKDKDQEIKELKQIIEAKDKKIKELEEELTRLKSSQKTHI